VLLSQTWTLDAVPITASATARGINSTCKIEFSHPVTAPVDATSLVRGFLKRICGYYFEGMSDHHRMGRFVRWS
jgi:hypothetical protein